MLVLCCLSWLSSEYALATAKLAAVVTARCTLAPNTWIVSNVEYILFALLLLFTDHLGCQATAPNLQALDRPPAERSVNA